MMNRFRHKVHHLVHGKSARRASRTRKATFEQLENRRLFAGLEQSTLLSAVTVHGEADNLLHWTVDENGDGSADRSFAFGWTLDNNGLGPDRPLIGDFDHDGAPNAIIVRPQPNGLLRWFVDVDGDSDAELFSFEFGFNTDVPLIGDINGDGKDEPVVVRQQANGLLRWYYDTNGDPAAEGQFEFGWNFDTPLLADIDNDGTVNPIVVREGEQVEPNSTIRKLYWYVDTDRDAAAEQTFQFGWSTGTPVVYDGNADGTLDVGMVHQAGSDLFWMMDTNHDRAWDGRDVSITLGAANAQPVPGPAQQDGLNLVRRGDALMKDGAPVRLIGYGDYGMLTESAFDYRRYLDKLAEKGLNFTRVWANYHWTNDLSPYEKIHGKWDLTKPNQAFYDRLSSFVQYAESKGVIVQVTLFDAVALDPGGNRYGRSPWNPANNVNGIDGEGNGKYDPSNNFGTQVTDAYPLWRDVNKPLIHRVVDTLGDYSNVTYEVMNEPAAPRYERVDHVNTAFHDAVIDELQIAFADKSGSKLISINADSQSLRDLAKTDPRVGLVAFHIEPDDDKRELERKIQEYRETGKPVIVSNDGDATQTTLAQCLPVYTNSNDRRCDMLKNGGRLSRTRDLLSDTFAREGDLGDIHFEFLDKGLNGSSWNPNTSSDYNPRLFNVNNQILDTLSRYRASAPVPRAPVGDWNSRSTQPLGTAVATLVEGMLHISGTAYQDRITVSVLPTGVVTVKASANSSSQLFVMPAAAVTTIRVNGNRGNDVIANHTAVASTIYGGDGDDTIRGGHANDQLFGELGNDVIQGGNGDDTIEGNAGDDQLHGDAGNDRVYGQNGHDWIFGDGGGDHLNGGEGNDHVYGGSGDDRMFGREGDDEMHGGAGNDRLEAGDGQDTVFGGQGNDAVYGQNGHDWIFGDDGNDHMNGGEGNDRVYGGSGNDRMFGRGGDDEMHGEQGEDQMWGDSGNDVLYGEDNNDRMYGGAGNDTMRGGAGNDRLEAGDGHDSVFGGQGNDAVYGQNGNDWIFGDDGGDYMNGGAGNDRVYGGSGNDRMFGRGGDDEMHGGHGNDQMWGDSGNDSLFGEDGNDVMDAGSGNDVLDGGLGANTMRGGSGHDRFRVIYRNWRINLLVDHDWRRSEWIDWL